MEALIFTGILALLSIFILVKMVTIVPQGFQYTVERFGKYTTLLKPGLHLVMPLVDRVGSKINMMENVFDVPQQDVITKDNARVTVDGIVFYQVIDAVKASYEVNNLSQAILYLTTTNIRTVMGSMDLDELLSQRENINSRLLGVVDEATNPWGIKVTRIEIKDITPPKDLIDAMANQMKAERIKRATILQSEGERQAAILLAEGQRQSVILEAEGQKEATYRAAEARERSAAAEAKSTQLVSDAIGKGNVQAINYFVAQKYIEALSQIAAADNSKVIFMPLEASNLIGAVGGITELLKETANKAVSKNKV